MTSSKDSRQLKALIVDCIEDQMRKNVLSNPEHQNEKVPIQWRQTGSLMRFQYPHLPEKEFLVIIISGILKTNTRRVAKEERITKVA